MKKNFLVLGSGAREHAIADSLLKSNFLNKLFLASPNDGFAPLGEEIVFSNYENLAEISMKKGVDILVVGPEQPLCDGVTEIFKAKGIDVIGVDKKWSQLESSKYFAKRFLKKHGIKTADYLLIKDVEDIDLIKFKKPFVIKADGLCKGKGVSLVFDEEDARETIKDYLSGKFDEASKTVLLEEFLSGEELSLMSLWDGANLLSFLPARDFKRLSDKPDSPNTGGMGAFCPVSLSVLQQERLDEYEKKLKNALASENADFTGFIYSGLIWHEEDYFVLEYNVRLGDPEAQAILVLLDSDLGEIFIKAVDGKLDEINFKWVKDKAACLTIASQGYPFVPNDDKKITNIPANRDGVKVFFAGVKKKNDSLCSSGGRVLSVCALGASPFEKAVKIADMIEIEAKYYRTDITL